MMLLCAQMKGPRIQTVALLVAVLELAGGALGRGWDPPPTRRPALFLQPIITMTTSQRSPGSQKSPTIHNSTPKSSPFPSPTKLSHRHTSRNSQQKEEVKQQQQALSPAYRTAPARSPTDSTTPSWDASLTFPFILLNLVTILWGTQHAVIKSTLLTSPDHPGLINFLRFTLASLLFLPWTPNPFDPSKGQGIWKSGLELGIWMFLGYAFQAIGLGWTTASRSGFLLYLNVKLVPIFAFFLLGRVITRDVWVSAITAFTGTALLSFDGTPPNIGDFWSVMAAAASAMFILRLEGAAQKWSADNSRELNSATLWMTAGFCGLWWLVESVLHHTDTGTMVGVVEENWVQVVYLGVVTTALCNWIQTVGQRSVPAEKAALIYAMDPVWGALFSYLILGEKLGPQGWVGGAMVTGAALWSSWMGMSGPKTPSGSRTNSGSETSVIEMGNRGTRD